MKKFPLSAKMFLGCAFSFAATVPSALHAGNQIKASEFVAKLADDGKLGLIMQRVSTRLGVLIPEDSTLRERVLGELSGQLRQNDWSVLDHFPIIPVYRAAQLRAALGGLGGGATEDVVLERFSGKLSDFFAGPCTETAPLPRVLNPDFPELTEGHEPDTSLSPCEVHQSYKLARLLNSLVRRELGSEVRHEGERAQSAQKFFAMLMSAGHTIEMVNERTYANFVALNYKGAAVIWPTWGDTGLKTKDGTPIVIPVGHSQHSWTVRGPIVNAKVAFFLGTSGVGFFAQAHKRPAWTGMRSEYTLSSTNPDEAGRILATADYAGRYYRRIIKEAEAYAVGMPANGYGYLGVCNDSNAALETISKPGESTVYPLVRDASLKEKSKQGDGLDERLAALPNDANALPTDRVSVLKRVQAMYPFDSLQSPDLHDNKLRSVMQAIAQELKSEI